MSFSTFYVFQCKTVLVGSNETAQSCVKRVLDLLEIKEDAKHYQLWVRTGPSESRYPLIGHERPFAIQRSSVRGCQLAGGKSAISSSFENGGFDHEKWGVPV